MRRRHFTASCAAEPIPQPHGKGMKDCSVIQYSASEWRGLGLGQGRQQSGDRSSEWNSALLRAQEGFGILLLPLRSAIPSRSMYSAYLIHKVDAAARDLLRCS